MDTDGAVVAQLLPFLLLAIPMAIGNYFVARALGHSRTVWVVLSLIPGLNFLFLYYVGYVVVVRVLNRLDEVAAKLDRLPISDGSGGPGGPAARPAGGSC